MTMKTAERPTLNIQRSTSNDNNTMRRISELEVERSMLDVNLLFLQL
jgi:hypothetical protein